MEITNKVETETRDEWRKWFAQNHATEKFCWLPVTRGMWGASGDRGIPYLDAVEEALCFGWIDSTSKNGYQRFSPRTKKSNWTELNRVRCERLETFGLMTDAGRAVLPIKPFEIHAEVMKAIESDTVVLANFNSFPETYKRVRIDNIQSYFGSTCGTYEKRLDKFIENTRAGKMFGQWDDDGRLQ